MVVGQRTIRVVTVSVLGAGLLLGLLIFASTAGAFGVNMNATINGRVMDTSGNPVPNCEVYLHQQGILGWHQEKASGLTDASGNYSISTTWWSEDYTHTFTADFGRYSQGKWRAQLYGGWQMLDSDVKSPGDQIAQNATHFTLGDGETKTLDTVVLKKYMATVKGRVTDKYGKPIVGVSVIPLRRTNGELAAWGPADDVYSAADGSFSVEVPPINRPEQQGYVVHFAKTNLGVWQPMFFGGIPSQEEWQASTLWTIQTQAMQGILVPVKIDSEQTLDASTVLPPLIKETLKVTSVSPSSPRKGKNFTLKARLTAGHTYNTPKVKFQLYRYNTSKKKWVAYGDSKTAKIAKRNPGSVDYKLTTRVNRKGKFRAVAVVGKHWTNSKPHVARRSARKAFTVK